MHSCNFVLGLLSRLIDAEPWMIKCSFALCRVQSAVLSVQLLGVVFMKVELAEC